jgi:hypothetical protein
MRAQPLEPVFGDIAGIARGAAGRDRDALDVLEVERQLHRQLTGSLAMST